MHIWELALIALFAANYENEFNLHFSVCIALRSLFLYIILQIMRQRRIQRGALTLASAEVKFQIDTETHDPLDIGMLSKQKVIFPLLWNKIGTR